jgi:hypothetical protein
VDAEALKAGFTRFDVDGNEDDVVANTRAIFMEQLSQLVAKRSI